MIGQSCSLRYMSKTSLRHYCRMRVPDKYYQSRILLRESHNLSSILRYTSDQTMMYDAKDAKDAKAVKDRNLGNG